MTQYQITVYFKATNEVFFATEEMDSDTQSVYNIYLELFKRFPKKDGYYVKACEVNTNAHGTMHVELDW